MREGEWEYLKTELELPTRLAFNLLSPSCLLALSRAVRSPLAGGDSTS